MLAWPFAEQILVSVPSLARTRWSDMEGGGREGWRKGEGRKMGG